MSLLGKTIFTLAEIAKVRSISKGAAFRWLQNTEMLVEIGRDSGGAPRWGTTLPLLLARAPEMWAALSARLLAGGKCPTCGQEFVEASAGRKQA